MTTGNQAVPRPPAERVPVDVRIGADRCVGCLACADVCKAGALHLIPGVWAVEADVARCTACRRCEAACPFHAVAVTGTPRNKHHLVLDTLQGALASTCPPDWTVSTRPPGFRSPTEPDGVVPDLAVVRTARRGPAWLGEGDGAVSLVVEVTSPTSRDADAGPRRDTYWQCGVPAYWTVDQRTGAVEVQWSTGPAWFDRWAGFAFC